MAGYGFYNYGNATANTPASAVGDTLVGTFNRANLNNANMRIPNQWGSSALLGAEGKPYQPSGWSSMFAPDTFQGLGTVATPVPTQKEFSLSPVVQQQVQQPQQQPVQVRAATADVQPTTSQPISPIGLQSVTNAMNAQPTAGNTIPQSANTGGWFGTLKNWVGDALGIPSEQQYLKNQNGTLMEDKYGNNIIDPNQRTWTDVGAMAGSLANTAMGAYGMFTGFDQGQQQLDTQRGQLNLMRDKYEEDKRKNQAIVAQNRGA